MLSQMIVEISFFGQYLLRYRPDIPTELTLVNKTGFTDFDCRTEHIFT